MIKTERLLLQRIQTVTESVKTRTALFGVVCTVFGVAYSALSTTD